MIKECEICETEFETQSQTRIYCYKCSGESTRSDNKTRKHQKTILRRSMKVQAIKYVLQRAKLFIFFSGLPTDAVTMLTHLTAFSGPPEAIVKNKKYRPARTLS